MGSLGAGPGPSAGEGPRGEGEGRCRGLSTRGSAFWPGAKPAARGLSSTCWTRARSPPLRSTPPPSGSPPAPPRRGGARGARERPPPRASPPKRTGGGARKGQEGRGLCPVLDALGRPFPHGQAGSLPAGGSGGLREAAAAPRTCPVAPPSREGVGSWPCPLAGKGALNSFMH